MKKKNRRVWLWIAIACMLISIIGSSLVQTSFGDVEIRKINLVVGDDDTLYAQMYIPKDATADHKLPLVVLQHGSQHNLQMQDMNMVELARRGFIVISGDALGHGSSTPRGLAIWTASIRRRLAWRDTQWELQSFLIPSSIM